jgi:phosphopantetheine--protein transferase-like protein
MITGIGVDIVKIDRFEQIIAAPVSPFMHRVFTEREREWLDKRKANSIAGVFAAKEAVAKALGTGFSKFSPADVEILHKENGKPYVVLHNAAKKSARRCAIHISISHTDTDAIAYAVIEM